MYPELIRLGSVVIHSYGFMIALAIVISSFMLYREAPREKIKPDLILEAILITAFSGLIGARLLYIAIHWNDYGNNLFSAIFSRFEGLSFYGALPVGVAALYYWCNKRKINFLKIADLLAPYLALSYAFARIGCFLNGCCYGIQSSLPWALPAQAGDPILRHPVQLYAALGAIAIFIVLKVLRPYRPFVGFMAIALLALYSILRFTTEFFSLNERTWLSLTMAQLFSLGLLITVFSAIALYFYIPAGDIKQGSNNFPSENNNNLRRNRNRNG